MTKLRTTFIWCGVLGVGSALLLSLTGATAIVPPLHSLVEHGGASQLLATAVLALNTWVLLMLLALSNRNSREAASLAAAKPRGGLGHPRTAVREALEQVRSVRGAADPAQAESLVGGRSAVRGARAETPYAVIRALVWALPALGFIGTAAEMSRSIRGLSGAMHGTANYADLSGILVSDVIRPLASAFGITLFALGSSVVCHLLVSFVHTREERLLLELDELVLTRLSEAAGGVGSRRDLAAEAEAAEAMSVAMRAAANGVKELSGELNRLRTEASQVRFDAREAKPDRTEEVIQHLGNIGAQLGAIGEGMDRDMVLTPVRTRGRVPGQNGFPGGRDLPPGGPGMPGDPGDGVF
ncbi:hypothetical protein FCH28_11610 [Streptomyces piniterrae]|uniref:Uncharacterized protein n=1 Tax=Streptomyces piniterrae TaxID=2571125 RepID=A0A4U0NN81_9ACTN|nr:MotA/TolQ/ExbB proton channel family protein [Streptomyces piniterrae]TJZ55919.1 hypothetical protein FCH28_11610 [Streptomyces piniterrae]